LLQIRLYLEDQNEVEAAQTLRRPASSVVRLSQLLKELTHLHPIQTAVAEIAITGGPLSFIPAESRWCPWKRDHKETRIFRRIEVSV
jgi:hypothetical protein